ncbi:MAG: hypothetical protein VW802_05090 [Rhodospirillaceae bacterium]|jgi:hypothetical protein
MSVQITKTVQWFLGLQSFIMTDPRYEGLRPLFSKNLNQENGLMSLRSLHHASYQAIFRNLSQPAETMMIDAIDSFISEKLGVSKNMLSEGKRIEAIAQNLVESSYAMLPTVSGTKVAEMRDYFERTPCYGGPYDPDCPEPAMFSVDELREQGENTARYKTRDVIECPHVMRTASDPALLSIMTKHLGTVPMILDYSCWWSFAQEDQNSQHAQLYHFDLADYRFCLMFIYLTDVDMDGGPHTLFPQTHEMDDVAKIREQYAGDAAEWDDWYFHNLRKTDDDMDRFFNGREPVSLTGDKGSTLLVNTRSIHKGLVPTKQDRLIIQVVYGVTPMLQTLFDDPIKYGTPAAAHIPDWTFQPPGNYANWFFAAK